MKSVTLWGDALSKASTIVGADASEVVRSMKGETMKVEVAALLNQIAMLMKNHHLNEMEIRLIEDCMKRIVEIVGNLEDMLHEDRKD